MTTPSGDAGQGGRSGAAESEIAVALKPVKTALLWLVFAVASTAGVLIWHSWRQSMAISATPITAVSAASTSTTPISALAGRPECPHDPGPIWIAAKYSAVPEFHDCQKLILKDASGLKYGPLAAVFLGIGAIEGTTSVPFDATPGVVIVPPNGSVDQVSAIPQGITVAVTNKAANTVLVPYVEVVSEGAYAYLGIATGFNCMYIVEFLTAANEFVSLGAKMVNAGPVEIPCTDKTLMNAPGTTLTIFRRGPAPPGTTVPRAARWDWNEIQSIHTIGIPCGTNWCDVGPVSSSPEHGSGFPKAVKGWYDEQHLADYDAVNKTIVPSNVVGTVYPEANLDTRNGAYYSGFKDVARVAMSASTAKYENRYGYGAAPATTPVTSMATVALCYGARETCLPASAPATVQCNVAPQMAGLPATRAVQFPWWARITSPDASKVNYFCVGYRGLPDGYVLPNMVRWRWRADDETIWVPCAQGCCEVDVDIH